MPLDLASIYVAGFTPRDRRELDEWAESNIVVGSWSPWEGAFTTERTPWIVAPLRVLGLQGPRHVTIFGPAAGGKSTIGEVFAAWAIDNAPGFMAWYAQDEEAAKEFAETRVQRFLESCERVRRWFPANRHARRVQAIHFPHMSLVIQAANQGNAQAKHIRHEILDEPWLYKPGMLRQLHKRTNRFAHNRTILELTTGSMQGDEVYNSYEAGTRQEWQFLCPSCNRHHVPRWSFGERGAGQGGVKWVQDARREDGTWDKRRVVETTEYECPHCGARFAANSANAYTLNRGGCYTEPAKDAMPRHWSFHWSSIASDFAQLGEIVVEFMEAMEAVKLGTTVLLQEFTQKRLAEAWAESVAADSTTHAVSDYTLADAVPQGWIVLMAVDCQQTHYWAAVRAFAADGTLRSRLIACARLESMESVREFQVQHGVPDDSVLVDSGKWPDSVYIACCRYGWHAIKGEKVPGGYTVTQPDGAKIRALARQSDARPTPSVLAAGSVQTSCALFMVSEELTSEILANCRDGRVDGWSIPADAPDFYRAQLAARVRRRVKIKGTGRDAWEWKTIGKQGEHLWDCERYLLAAAFVAGAFDFKPTTQAEEEKTDAATA